MYRAISDRDLIDVKQAAVEHCGQAGIGVVLVPTLVPGVNDDQIGAVLDYAVSHMPQVKGVNFQPFGRLGTVPLALLQATPITIPDVLRAIEGQTGGLMKAADFSPVGIEHALCSFAALYVVDMYGDLKPVSRSRARGSAESMPEKVRRVIPLQWQGGPFPSLTVGGMLFQDVWNVDVNRLMRCPTHIIGDGRLYPLCSKYLTSARGERLYPGID